MARSGKERAEKSAKDVQERVAKAYDHETPTPTQAENDAAMSRQMGQQDLPEGSGFTPAPSPYPTAEQQKRKNLEATQPAAGGYATRSSTPKAE
jgi:hypothetical protein